jgi:LytS/YehU family sensor histidine kinase
MNSKILLIGIVLSIVLGAVFGLIGFATGYITSIYVIVSAGITGYAITFFEKEKALTNTGIAVTAIVCGILNFAMMYLTMYIMLLNSLPVFARGDLAPLFLSDLNFIDLGIFFISVIALYQVLSKNEKKKLKNKEIKTIPA